MSSIPFLSPFSALFLLLRGPVTMTDGPPGYGRPACGTSKLVVSSTASRVSLRLASK